MLVMTSMEEVGREDSEGVRMDRKGEMRSERVRSWPQVAFFAQSQLTET